LCAIKSPNPSPRGFWQWYTSPPIGHGDHERWKLIFSAVHKFQFISIQNPADAKDCDERRLARSHAIRQALQSRRKLLQASTSDASETSAWTLVSWSVFAPASAYGRFETIFGESAKLSILLSYSKFCNDLREGLCTAGNLQQRRRSRQTGCGACFQHCRSYHLPGLRLRLSQ
jgi:hypothetical protein